MLLTGFSLQHNLINPAYQVVYAKKAVDINCVSDGPKVWFKDNRRASHRVLSVNNVFILNAQERDSGVYTCMGTTPDKKIFFRNSTLLIASKFLGKKYHQNYVVLILVTCVCFLKRSI